MSNTEDLNCYIAELMQRKRVKPCKNDKAYDRNKERKNKTLYDYNVEESNEDDIEQDA